MTKIQLLKGKNVFEYFFFIQINSCFRQDWLIKVEYLLYVYKQHTKLLKCRVEKKMYRVCYFDQSKKIRWVTRVSNKLNWQQTGVVKRDQILRGEYGKEADGFVNKSNKISI